MFSKVTLAVSCALVASTVAQECVPYASPYNFQTGYPTVWKKADQTTFSTPEFQSVYNSIDWTKVPNIQPKKMDASGAFISSDYPASDPDCWWTYKNCVTPKAPNIQPDIASCPEPETWGLTYDDGPNCTHTQFYDFLKANNQKATMFFIGSNVADWPKEAQRGLTDGHHICVHTWSHPYMTTLTNQEVVAELYYTTKAIKTVVGITPTCWRPPYGDVDDRVRAIAQQLKLTNIIWNLDSDDWQMAPAGNLPPSAIDQLFEGFVNMGKNGTFARSGAITLEHELNNGTMSMAEKWYPQIKQAFKHVVPVASCMNITTPYLETNYTYPDFAQYIAGDTNGNTSSNTSSTAQSSAQHAQSSTTSASASNVSEASTKSAAVDNVAHISLALFALIPAALLL
ncbi:glycoside hydrolase/deacetylase [Basidiobolus meristosporus CBS 931.73]|uniref:chitin deacetylase n=1 Tax=Basidiobolus meristosporus CBS 931.73 TaxID=1314790 RepID=A0A1Y1ZAG1_9FUNG|nr:glycoside hydrolase/deacetylase [Basidiobolus meristosporus CBS 931.73]|eukprot:ORY06987.1 glycoside hydrolase/deacetylase [Basidiobolus meristosporus CBS 931.73]